MTIDEKIQRVKELLKKIDKANSCHLRYMNFFKFLSFENNAKKHKTLNKAIKDLENNQYVGI